MGSSTSAGNVLISGGVQSIGQNAYASTVTITNGGVQNVLSNGSAFETVISSGGVQNVSKGALASDTIIYANGAQNVLSSGTAQDTTISGGVQTVFNDANVTNTLIAAGSQIVSGGTVTDTTLTQGLQIIEGGTVADTVISGGSIISTTLTDATQLITDGTVSGTVLSGGSQIISGGTVEDTTLSSASVSLYAAAALNDINAEQTTINVYSDQVIGGTTTLNQADVHMMHAGAFNTLQMDHLVANNANFHMNVDMQALTGDQLQINSSYTGDAQLQLTNTAPGAEKTTGDGIKLVQFDPSATVNGTFSIPGDIFEAGAYEYQLAQGTTSGEGKDYYLRNTQKYNPTFKTMLNMPVMNVVIAQTGMNSLQKRLGDLHQMDNTAKKQGVWVRSYYRDLTLNDLTKTDMTLFGAEAGYDWLFRADEPTKLYAGVLIGYVSMNTIESHKENNSYHKGDGESPTIGVYATLVNDERWFVDLAARNFWTKLDMKSHNSGGTEIEYKPYRNVMAVSIEGGKNFVKPLSSNTSMRFEPKLEFQYINASSGNTSVTNGTGKLAYDHADYLDGKAALLLGYDIKRSNGLLIEPLLELAYRYNFSGKNDITYAGTTEQSNLRGGNFEINAGIDMQFTKNLYGYVQGVYEKGQKVEGWGANIGIRYKFGADAKVTQTTGSLAQQEVKSPDQSSQKQVEPQEVTHMLFRFDKYTLTGASREEVIKFAHSYVEEKNTKYILVEGYTCDIGSVAYNQKLSERRANYVKKLLLANGVAEDKITVKAYGSTQFAKKGFGKRKDYRRAVISLYGK